VIEQLRAGLVLLAALVAVGPANADTQFAVDPEVGNNAFTAVFDTPIGERITAVSSAVGCTLAVEEARLEAKAHCSVPLASVRVDNDDTKTEHFGQWATNKQIDPKQCTFELDVPVVKLPSPVEAKTPVAFTTEGRFTICGRARDDGQPERIQGTVVYLPPGTYGAKRTLRIRATVDHFNREKYGVSPKNTPGWLARVQQLAPVVGTEGTIDVTLFATAADDAAAGGQPKTE
jgi:hypothetical protein